MTCHTFSPEETGRVAADLAHNLPGRILALEGELGSGKTTFAQAFLRTLGVIERITSPTFLIIKSYKLKAISYKLIYHVDCYRLHQPEELGPLDWQKIINDPEAIFIIEWADKIKSLLPPETIWLKFAHGKKETERTISMIK